MIQDIYTLHWNIIHKSTGVTWNVGPYKLIRLPGHPNLNLINVNLIKYNWYKITPITILITLKWSYYNSFTYQEHIKLTITFLIILIITTKEIVGNFTAKYPKPKTVTLEKPQLQACQKKNAIIVAPSINIFLYFYG